MVDPLELNAFEQRPSLATKYPQIIYTPESISKLYENVLGRDPEPAGLTQYAINLAAGSTLVEIESELITSKEFVNRIRQLISKDNGNTAVFALYNAVLKRSPDQSGIETYSKILNGDPNRTEEIIKSIYASKENRQRLIQQTYREILHREADPEGMQVYLSSELPMLQVVQELKESPEGKACQMKFSKTPFAEIGPSVEAQKTFPDLLSHLQLEGHQVYLRSYFQNDHHYFIMSEKNGKVYLSKMSIDRHKETEKEYLWCRAVDKQLSKQPNPPIGLALNTDQKYLGESFFQLQPYIQGRDLAQRNFSSKIETDVTDIKDRIPQMAWAAAFFDSLNVNTYKPEVSQDEVYDVIRIHSDRANKITASGLLNIDQINKLNQLLFSQKGNVYHGLQHGDLTPFNLRINENSSELILMDYEHGSVNNLPKGFDLALCYQRLWTLFDQPQLAKSLLREYCRISSKSPNEVLKIFMPSLISVFIGGMTDHINGDGSSLSSHKRLAEVILTEDWNQLIN